MNQKEKNNIIKQIEEFEAAFSKAESNISALANYVESYFDEEITTLCTTDGVAIVDNDGNQTFLKDFIESL